MIYILLLLTLTSCLNSFNRDKVNESITKGVNINKVAEFNIDPISLEYLNQILELISNGNDKTTLIESIINKKGFFSHINGVVNSDGDTMVYAIVKEKGFKDLAFLLIAKGASFTHTNKAGQKLSDLAKDDNRDMLLILEDEYAKLKDCNISELEEMLFDKDLYTLNSGNNFKLLSLLNLIQSKRGGRVKGIEKDNHSLIYFLTNLGGSHFNISLKYLQLIGFTLEDDTFDDLSAASINSKNINILSEAFPDYRGKLYKKLIDSENQDLLALFDIDSYKDTQLIAVKGRDVNDNEVDVLLTPLQYAVYTKNYNLIDQLGSENMLSSFNGILALKGRDGIVRNVKNGMVLHIALFNQDIDALDYLLSKMSSLNLNYANSINTPLISSEGNEVDSNVTNNILLDGINFGSHNLFNDAMLLNKVLEFNIPKDNIDEAIFMVLKLNYLAFINSNLTDRSFGNDMINLLLTKTEPTVEMLVVKLLGVYEVYSAFVTEDSKNAIFNPTDKMKEYVDRYIVPTFRGNELDNEQKNQQDNEQENKLANNLNNELDLYYGLRAVEICLARDVDSSEIGKLNLSDDQKNNSINGEGYIERLLSAPAYYFIPALATRENININYPKESISLIEYAVRNNNFSLVENLVCCPQLELGIYSHTAAGVNSDGNTILHLAALLAVENDEYSPDIFRYLVKLDRDNGLDINALNSEGKTALHILTNIKEVKRVKLIVDAMSTNSNLDKSRLAVNKNNILHEIMNNTNSEEEIEDLIAVFAGDCNQFQINGSNYLSDLLDLTLFNVAVDRDKVMKLNLSEDDKSRVITPYGFPTTALHLTILQGVQDNRYYNHFKEVITRRNFNLRVSGKTPLELILEQDANQLTKFKLAVKTLGFELYSRLWDDWDRFLTLDEVLVKNRSVDNILKLIDNNQYIVIESDPNPIATSVRRGLDVRVFDRVLDITGVKTRFDNLYEMYKIYYDLNLDNSIRSSSDQFIDRFLSMVDNDTAVQNKNYRDYGVLNDEFSLFVNRVTLNDIPFRYGDPKFNTRFVTESNKWVTLPAAALISFEDSAISFDNNGEDTANGEAVSGEAISGEAAAENKFIKSEKSGILTNLVMILRDIKSGQVGFNDPKFIEELNFWKAIFNNSDRATFNQFNEPELFLCCKSYLTYNNPSPMYNLMFYATVEDKFNVVSGNYTEVFNSKLPIMAAIDNFSIYTRCLEFLNLTEEEKNRRFIYQNRSNVNVSGTALHYALEGCINFIGLNDSSKRDLISRLVTKDNISMGIRKDSLGNIITAAYLARNDLVAQQAILIEVINLFDDVNSAIYYANNLKDNNYGIATSGINQIVRSLKWSNEELFDSICSIPGSLNRLDTLYELYKVYYDTFDLINGINQAKNISNQFVDRFLSKNFIKNNIYRYKNFNTYGVLKDEVKRFLNNIEEDKMDIRYMDDKFNERFVSQMNKWSPLVANESGDEILLGSIGKPIILVALDKIIDLINLDNIDNEQFTKSIDFYRVLLNNADRVMKFDSNFDNLSLFDYSLNRVTDQKSGESSLVFYATVADKFIVPNIPEGNSNKGAFNNNLPIVEAINNWDQHGTFLSLLALTEEEKNQVFEYGIENQPFVRRRGVALHYAVEMSAWSSLSSEKRARLVSLLVTRDNVNAYSYRYDTREQVPPLVLVDDSLVNIAARNVLISNGATKEDILIVPDTSVEVQRVEINPVAFKYANDLLSSDISERLNALRNVMSNDDFIQNCNGPVTENGDTILHVIFDPARLNKPFLNSALETFIFKTLVSRGVNFIQENAFNEKPIDVIRNRVDGSTIELNEKIALMSNLEESYQLRSLDNLYTLKENITQNDLLQKATYTDILATLNLIASKREGDFGGIENSEHDIPVISLIQSEFNSDVFNKFVSIATASIYSSVSSSNLINLSEEELMHLIERVLLKDNLRVVFDELFKLLDAFKDPKNSGLGNLIHFILVDLNLLEVANLIEEGQDRLKIMEEFVILSGFQNIFNYIIKIVQTPEEYSDKISILKDILDRIEELGYTDFKRLAIYLMYNNVSLKNLNKDTNSREDIQLPILHSLVYLNKLALVPLIEEVSIWSSYRTTFNSIRSNKNSMIEYISEDNIEATPFDIAFFNQDLEAVMSLIRIALLPKTGLVFDSTGLQKAQLVNIGDGNTGDGDKGNDVNTGDGNTGDKSSGDVQSSGDSQSTEEIKLPVIALVDANFPIDFRKLDIFGNEKRYSNPAEYLLDSSLYSMDSEIFLNVLNYLMNKCSSNLVNERNRAILSALELKKAINNLIAQGSQEEAFSKLAPITLAELDKIIGIAANGIDVSLDTFLNSIADFKEVNAFLSTTSTRNVLQTDVNSKLYNKTAVQVLIDNKLPEAELLKLELSDDDNDATLIIVDNGLKANINALTYAINSDYSSIRYLLSPQNIDIPFNDMSLLEYAVSNGKYDWVNDIVQFVETRNNGQIVETRNIGITSIGMMSAKTTARVPIFTPIPKSTEKYIPASFSNNIFDIAFNKAANIEGYDVRIFEALCSSSFLDVNVLNEDGDTVLHRATKLLGDKLILGESIIKAVIKDKRVNKNILNSDGLNILHIAYLQTLPNTDTNGPVRRYLRSNFGKYFCGNNNQFEPFMRGIFNTNVFQDMVINNPDQLDKLNLTNSDKERIYQVVNWIKGERNISINSPLHFAIENQYSILDKLITSRNINLVINGKTPLDLAKDMGSSSLEAFKAAVLTLGMDQYNLFFLNPIRMKVVERLSEHPEILENSEIKEDYQKYFGKISDMFDVNKATNEVAGEILGVIALHIDTDGYYKFALFPNVSWGSEYDPVSYVREQFISSKSDADLEKFIEIYTATIAAVMYNQALQKDAKYSLLPAIIPDLAQVSQDMFNSISNLRAAIQNQINSGGTL